MTPWLYEGVFWFELADRWKVTESDNLVQVVPPEPVGALHISVLQRTRLTPLSKDEAVELVVNFAQKQGRALEATGADAGDHVVANASFTAQDKCWEVQARVWLGRAFVSSYCHDGSREDLRKAAENMMESIHNIGYPCPCCGFLTLDEQPPGTYNICPVCFWEDDAVQFEDPEYRGGANGVSLREARENFTEIGACEARVLDLVRPPQPYEVPPRQASDS